MLIIENNNNLQIFENNEFGNIRVVMQNNEPWFVGKDVATILGYSNTRDALNKRVDDEDKGVANCDTLGGTQNMTIINESGLYSLILSSKLPTAKKFKHWVTSEVLPSIRKHGAYVTDEVMEKILDNPDFGIKILTELKNERKKRKELEKKVEEDTPKVKFAEAVSNSNGTISMNDMAKLLQKDGIKIGRNKLFEILRYLDILQANNRPYQKYMRYFEVIEKINFLNKVNIITRVNGNGQIYITKKIKKLYCEDN